MFAAGACPRQPRLRIQQPFERSRISGHDGFRGCFKLRVGRPGILKRIQMFHKLWPAFESMRSRNHELRVGQRTLAVISAHLTAREGRHFIDPGLDPHRQMRRNGDAGERNELLNPALRPDISPIAVRAGRFGSTPAGFQKILGDFAVALQIRAQRKRQRALRVGKHTNLLPLPARSPHQSG